MISVTKIIVLVVALVISISSHLTQCQFLNDDFGNDDQLYQLDPADQQLNTVGYSYITGGESDDTYYDTQNQEQADRNDLMIGSLADELLAARHGQEQTPESMESVMDMQREGFTSLLLDQLNNQKRQKPSSGYYYYDVNSHLPPLGDGSEHSNSISSPVNDPEEFEAKLGQLTDALNHNMANTKDRQELLLGFLNRSDELEGRTGINSLSSISRHEMDQLVGELSKMLEDQASNQEDQQQQQQQEQQQQQHQQQQQRADSDATDGYDLDTISRYGGSEYIDHPLALVGHQYVQGGAGEGRQLLGPDGTYENVQVIKTDSAIPSYCDPPNPCPIGYTAKDGCLEEFVNSASFSREYQAQQKCSCDNEHSLFNCAAPVSSSSGSSSSSSSNGDQQPQQSKQDATSNAPDETLSSSTTTTTSTTTSSSPFEFSSKLDTLARTIQNRFGGLASVQRLIGKQQQREQEGNGDHDNTDSLSPLLSGNDDANPNYLVRSARKLSSLDMHHKVDLD